jgi:SAM-dependent methyltransferase
MSLTLRQQLAGMLRKLRLLSLADYLWFLRLQLRHRQANRGFRKENPETRIPPSLILYDILGACDIAGFFQSGKVHALSISTIIHQHFSGETLKILEWGCGPARVLQYLKSPDNQPWKLYGSDYNARTIEWCRLNLPGIKFFQNGLEPPIETDSSTFDVVYCISVFTHLSESLHYKWIEEILRLLKPGGLFIGTFHGERYRDHLSLEEQKSFDAGQLVVRDKIREGKKNYAAYQSDCFVLNLLSPFASAWTNDHKCFQQTVWCAVK